MTKQRNSIFRGAVPYEEALQRLDAAFAPKPGDLITHEELARVIQAEFGSNRYDGVLDSWKRKLHRERGLQNRTPVRLGGPPLAVPAALMRPCHRLPPEPTRPLRPAA